jgi:hypothetical protein
MKVGIEIYVESIEEEKMNEKVKTKPCPHCKELILEDEINCRYCHCTIWPSHGRTCSYCKEDIKSGAIKCTHCLSALLSLALKVKPARTGKFQHTFIESGNSNTFYKHR